MSVIVSHIRQHSRFYGAALLGGLAWLGLGTQSTPLRIVIAGDVFFIAYLLAVTVLLGRAGGTSFRERVSSGDEGLILVSVLALAGVALSMSAIFLLLNQHGRDTPYPLLFSILSVPLAWVTLHTIYAFHYAHLYFAASGRKGLAFPGTDDPQQWEFLYFSFVIGMTAQVSDVNVTSSRLRRLVLAHGVVAFFFNAVILALAVNVVVTLSS